MSRRALRKIDSRIDLSRYLVIGDKLPRPWEPTALFGRLAPLEIDVGSGKGLFLVRAARARPAHDFLGVEIAAKYARFAAARLAREELSNARIVCGDAARLFREGLPDRASVAVHLYFPDPWWKKRHHKRRLISAAFVREVVRVLAPGGVLHYWTDVPEQFAQSIALFAAEPALAGPLDVPEAPAQHELDYQTNFERRMRREGIKVYRAQFFRR
jgi:tRNA (guanine-N7-)-methyltransferase